MSSLPSAMAYPLIDYPPWSSESPYKSHRKSKSFKAVRFPEAESVVSEVIQPPSDRERICLDNFEDHAKTCALCSALKQDRSSGRLRCPLGDELAVKLAGRLVVKDGCIFKARHWDAGRHTRVEINVGDFPYARPFFDLTLSRSQSCQPIFRHDRSARDTSRATSERMSSSRTRRSRASSGASRRSSSRSTERARSRRRSDSPAITPEFSDHQSSSRYSENSGSDTMSPSPLRHPATPADSWIEEREYAESLPNYRRKSSGIVSSPSSAEQESAQCISPPRDRTSPTQGSTIE